MVFQIELTDAVDSLEKCFELCWCWNSAGPLEVLETIFATLGAGIVPLLEVFETIFATLGAGIVPLEVFETIFSFDDWLFWWLGAVFGKVCLAWIFSDVWHSESARVVCYYGFYFRFVLSYVNELQWNIHTNTEFEVTSIMHNCSKFWTSVALNAQNDERFNGGDLVPPRLGLGLFVLAAEDLQGHGRTPHTAAGAIQNGAACRKPPWVHTQSADAAGTAFGIDVHFVVCLQCFSHLDCRW